MPYAYRSAIGQDSHRFVRSGDPDENKRLVLGGIHVPQQPGLAGNSDADVILHALTNAISGLTGINVLGGPADQLCKDEGITDSRAYLKMALSGLAGWQLYHISISVEAKRPRLSALIPAIRQSIARLCGLPESSVGLTATSGEMLTDFGKGEGMQAFCIVTARLKED